MRRLRECLLVVIRRAVLYVFLVVLCDTLQAAVVADVQSLRGKEWLRGKECVVGRHEIV
jgi:hypothetical protein